MCLEKSILIKRAGKIDKNPQTPFVFVHIEKIETQDFK